MKNVLLLLIIVAICFIIIYFNLKSHRLLSKYVGEKKAMFIAFWDNNNDHDVPEKEWERYGNYRRKAALLVLACMVLFIIVIFVDSRYHVF